MNQASEILHEVKKAVIGQDHTLRWVLAAILARGHILLEDVPGVGKTTLALAFSRAMDLQCARVQFTPDILPSDITGYSVLSHRNDEPVYRPGAVLCNLFLADELNRAACRTQSALLEAMEEGQVTVDGITHRLPEPFFVIATQNPAGSAGTQALPEAQLDRFSVCLSLGYPQAADECSMLRSRQGHDPLGLVSPIVSRSRLQDMQREVSSIFIKEEVIDYIVHLVRATRTHPQLLRGASPRVSLSVAALAQAMAYLDGRDFVIPADVQAVFPTAAAHRVLPSPGVSARSCLQEILREIPAPHWYST